MLDTIFTRQEIDQMLMSYAPFKVKPEKMAEFELLPTENKLAVMARAYRWNLGMTEKLQRWAWLLLQDIGV